MERHHAIVNAAEELACDCYWDRIDPSVSQVVATVESNTRLTLNDHEQAVAWQAYRERFVDWELGRVNAGRDPRNAAQRVEP